MCLMSCVSIEFTIIRDLDASGYTHCYGLIWELVAARQAFCQEVNRL